jgi:hypothetical protein
MGLEARYDKVHPLWCVDPENRVPSRPESDLDIIPILKETGMSCHHCSSVPVPCSNTVVLCGARFKDTPLD